MPSSGIFRAIVEHAEDATLEMHVSKVLAEFELRRAPRRAKSSKEECRKGHLPTRLKKPATIQIDHVGGTRAEGGLEVYINGELWVYLGNNNNTNIVLTRIELAAQNNDDGGAIYYDNVLAAPAVVPEPASAALLTGVITGLGVLACKRRVGQILRGGG